MRLGKPNATGTPILDDLCNVAAAYVRETGCLSVIVMHGKQPHMLVLWPDDLEEILSLCREKRDKMESDRAA